MLIDNSSNYENKFAQFLSNFGRIENPRNWNTNTPLKFSPQGETGPDGGSAIGVVIFLAMIFRSLLREKNKKQALSLKKARHKCRSNERGGDRD